MSHDPRPQPDDDGKGPRLGLYLWLGALAGIALLVFVLVRAFPDENHFSNPDLIRILGVLALVSSSLLFVRQFKVKEVVRNVLLWLGVAAGNSQAKFTITASQARQALQAMLVSFFPKHFQS